MPEVVDEVILVDGNSSDGTVDVARVMRPDIRVVTDERSGKGLALRTGFAHSTGDIIVMIDADGSMAPSEIRRMVYLIEEGFDFVKGSRFMAGGGSLDITGMRRLGNRLLVSLVNLGWKVNFTDLCYGFCAFRRDALPAMALRSDGFEIETEINIRAIKAGLKITETPSLESHRRFGASHLRTFRDGARVLRKILVEWLNGTPDPKVGLVLESPPASDSAFDGIEVA
jgi:glycosyltransferase involved in cell wall biosynthesis